MDSGHTETIVPAERRWLERLDAAVNRFTGLTSLPDRIWLLKSRIEQRMNALSIRDMETYVTGLTEMAPGFDAELPALVESLRVGETGWFRHIRQFRDLARWVADQAASLSATATLRAWCAGCATGEEVYSLAMTLSDGMGHRIRCPFKILGTDISETTVLTARQGAVKTDETSLFPEGFLERYTRGETGHYRISDSIRKRCTFRVHNLMDCTYPGSFHLILCRNVLIYFSPDARRSVLDRLAKALRPDGALVLGYSESVQEVSELLVPHRMGDTVLWRTKRARLVTRDRADRGETRTPQEKTGERAGAHATGRQRRGSRHAATLPSEGVPKPVPGSGPAPSTAANQPRTGSSAGAISKNTQPGPKIKPVQARSLGARLELQVLRLNGSYAQEDMMRLARQLRELVAAEETGTAVVDLDSVEYMCDEGAAFLRRTAEHLARDRVQLVLVASRPGVVHWVKRCGLQTWAKVVGSLDTVLTAGSPRSR